MASGRRGQPSISSLGAIGFALVGFTFWVFSDTSIKFMGHYGLPPYEMVAGLGFFGAFTMLAYALARRQPGLLRPRRLRVQLARASLDVLGNISVVVALRHLSLTIFYILVFMAPMVIAILSSIFLREGLTWRKWAAILAGFAGVIIAVHPWGGTRQADWIGFLACMVCVTCFSINMVWSRVLTRTETPESLAFFSGVVGATIGTLLTLTLESVPMTPTFAIGLSAIALFGATGTLCFYIAVKHTTAANVSQYHYTQLITGTLMSYLVWRDKPGFYVLAGGTMILGAGLYIAMTAQKQMSVAVSG